MRRCLPLAVLLALGCSESAEPGSGGGGRSGGSGPAPTAGAGGSSVTSTGGTGNGASGGTSGNAGSAGTGSGGTAGTPAPGAVDSGSSSADSASDGGAEAGSPSAPAGGRFRCPAGPFETPKAGAGKSICGPQQKYNWSEGPTWIASQNAFFFSNFVVGAAGPGDMLKYTPSTGVCETFLERVGCNGLGVSNDGQILAACHTPRALMKYDPATKQGTVVLKMVDGQQLDSPNDVIQHSNGTIYFTNPRYELAGRPGGLGLAAVRIDPMGSVSVITRGGLNGIGLSPDEKKLYIGQQGVWDLDDQGVPTKKAGGFPTGGDGFAIDCAGNLYSQSGAVVNPQGQRIASVPGGTNMAFGGPDGKLLLVVKNKSAQVVEVNVPGLP